MNICFNGCSFTVGEGFPIDLRELYIYDRLLEKKFSFHRTNIAVSGSSNYTIFMRSADAVMSGKYDCVITQWSALNRIWLNPGPDSKFFINDNLPEFQYRNIHLTKNEKRFLQKTLLLLNGDYNNIIDLIQYCNMLESLSELYGVKLGFINGLLPWTNDLKHELGNNLHDCLSSFSKNMLDFENRDDAEIIKFFKHLQDHFATLNQYLWVNLFDSFQNMIQDHGPEGHHPGIISHRQMCEKTSKFLIENKII